MSTHGTITFDAWGSKVTCEVVESRYPNAPNNQLALRLTEEDGMPYCVATRALENYFPPTPRHALVNDNSENRGILGHLERAGIVERTGLRIPSGYYELDEVIVKEA